MKTKVFFLEENGEKLDFFLKILTNLGYEVILPKNSVELFNFIEKVHLIPDLILLNNTSNSNDNYLICEELKQLKEISNIPIIFINKNGQNFEAEKFFGVEGSDFITLPCSEKEIIKRIENQIKIKYLESKLKEESDKLKKIIPHYQALQKALEKSKIEFKKISHSDIDPVTNLSNYSYFKKVLKQEWARASRQRSSFDDASGTNISLIIAQINNFDQYQQNYGEEIAPNCLKLLADAISKTAKRPADVKAVYQEDKFIILLPNTDQHGAQTVAEFIMNNVRELQIPHPYSNIHNYITLIMGIATGIPTQALSEDNLVEVAEKALAEALNQNQPEAIVIDNF